MNDNIKTRLKLIEELQELRRKISTLENNNLKKSEAEKARDEAYRIINSSPLVTFLWRNEEGWPVEFVTDNIKTVFGYKPRELYSGGIKYDQLVHPDDLGRVTEEVAVFSANDRCEEFIHDPYRIITKAGDIRWVDDRTNIRRNPEGKITHYQGIILDITDRKEYEAKLKENEERVSSTFNAISDAVFLHPLCKEGFSPFIEVNDTACKRYGYSREELMTMTAADITIAPDVQEHGRQSYRKNLEDKKNLIFETVHITKAGKKIPVEINSSIIQLAGQKIILAVVRDITDRKEAEKALHENIVQLQAVYNTVPIIIWSTDNKGVFTLSEGKDLRELGLRPGQIVGESVFEVYKDDPIIIENTKAGLSGKTSRYETEVMGNIYHCVLTPIFDNQNNILGVNGLAVNVTEKRKVEEELRLLRNYLSNIINSMPSVLVGVDSDGRITHWNKTVEENTGIPADTAQGNLLSDILPQMVLEMEKIRKSIKTRQIFQEQKRSCTVEKNAEYEDLTIYPLITNGVEGAVIRIDDVTEKVRMEEMLIQSEKMLSVGGLAAGMAHEINNPLAGMLQTAEVMAERLRRNSRIPANLKAAEDLGISIDDIEKFMEARDIPRMISIIRESGKRVAEIIENMLSFSRKSNEIVSSHDLSRLLDKTLRLAGTDYDLKRKYDFKLIKISRKYAKNLPPVPCEGAKIQQVLLNLFRNGAQAMQAAKTKNPEIKVSTYLDTQRKMVCMEIEDNGPGMDEEVRKRIFEPFYTTKPVGLGTGLGLSVSYFIIVENHNGNMNVESTPGKGTKFIIRLPG